MRQPKHMISKYNGTCSDCGQHIDAGEPIYWKARGVVQCQACMPSDDNAPANNTLPNSAAGSWSNALAWDATTPEPGASIQDDNAPRVSIRAHEYAQASQPATPKPAPAFTVVDTTPDPAPETTPQAAQAPAYAPADDLAVAMLQDQLIGLVNAIGKLSPDQVASLRDYCDGLSDTRDYTRKHCFTKLTELFGA